jgi:predicted Zn finger-like uncharacterized protein
MKIKCPDCSTAYDIKPEALGDEGRSVKCARCGNRWFVSPNPEPENLALPEDDEASLEDEASWADDEADEVREAEVPDSLPDDEEEDLDDEPPAQAAKPAARASDDIAGDDENGVLEPNSTIDIETMAKRPKIKVNPNKFKRNRIGAILNWLLRRNYRRISGIMLFLGAIACCAFLVIIRDSIVKQAPDLASLFEAVGLEVNLRGLEFRDLRTFQEIEEGRPVLVIEGSIRNIHTKNEPVPAVHLTIRGGDLQEIYAWTVEPRTKILKGLDETRFRTILADPPPGASDIQVRFINRGQSQVATE